MQKRILSLLVLLMTAVTGAWADETPLLTIESKDYTSFKSGSKTFDDKVTVTFSNSVSNDGDEWGWYSGEGEGYTLTVTAAEGYTITRVKFYNNSDSASDEDAPFEAIFVDNYYEGLVTEVNGTSLGAGGVNKIEVYGYETTGAGATNYTTLAVGDVIKVGDTFSPTAESEGAFNNNGVENGETCTLIRADVDNDNNVTEKTDGAYYVFKSDSGWNPYIHFEKAFAVTAISDGLEVTNIENIKGKLMYTLALHESAAPVAVTGVTLSPTSASLTVGDAVALTAAVAPADATDKKVKWSLAAGSDKVKLYKDADCNTEVGTEATDVLTVYAKGIAAGEATVKVESNADATKSATCTVTAVAKTWTSGDCTVTFSDGVMTVSGTGAMADYADYNYTPWSSYDVETIVIESGVTSIGKFALSRFRNLESVSIPASVTSIGERAFENCGSEATALTVSFAEGSTPLTIGESAFEYSNLKSIDIPNRVTSIGNSAFYNCSKLESVSIPASVTSIGEEAFENCGSNATALTVSFAEGSTPLTIGESAFYNANLKSIDIPNRVTSIGNYAFQSCSNLESVSIPASVTSIGERAFCYCSKLAKVSIYAPSLTTYGADAFKYNATGRKIYVLPKAVDTYKAGWPDYAADIEAMPGYGYTVTLKSGTEDATKWQGKADTGDYQALPLTGVEAGTTVTVKYFGTKKVESVKAVKAAVPVTWNTVDLSTLTADYEAQDGDKLTGTLSGNKKISIADGATVMLKNVNITNLGDNCNWAGINCPGDATLVLEGTNEVCAGRDGSGYNNYPGIWIAPGKTLTILGNGTLTAYSNASYPMGAGIGGGYGIACGNIVINSGTITATGGNDAAGIGGGNTSCGYITINGGNITATGGSCAAGIGGGDYASCGNITISGGTVSATGGDCSAGIGGGRNNGACGTITITSGVTSVTATKGEWGPNSIGRGDNGTAITVTIEDGANVTQN